MSELTNAVERVGRAGSENSKATQKLREACLQLANYISDDVFDFYTDIPPSKTPGVAFAKYRVGRYLAMEVDVEEDGVLMASFYRNANEWKREECLQFSRDIANGLLDHISKWLEERASESESAASIVKLHCQAKNRHFAIRRPCCGMTCYPAMSQGNSELKVA